MAVAFEKNTGLAKDVLGPGGMPPLPSGMGSSPLGEKRYEIDSTHGYPEQWVTSKKKNHKGTNDKLTILKIRVVI